MVNSASPRIIAKSIAAALAIATPAVVAFEGRNLISYLDPVGIPTICDGYTHGVRMGDTKTSAQCDEITRQELTSVAIQVDQLVTVPLTPERHAALTSFAYNAGTDALRRSTLLRLLNQGQTRAACDQLLRWVNAGGRKLSGLVRRREAERALCLVGVP